jgi:hypothetical protein
VEDLPSFVVDVLPNTMAAYSLLYFLFFTIFVHESQHFIWCWVSMGCGLLILSYALENTASLPSGTEAGVCS